MLIKDKLLSKPYVALAHEYGLCDYDVKVLPDGSVKHIPVGYSMSHDAIKVAEKEQTVLNADHDALLKSSIYNEYANIAYDLEEKFGRKYNLIYCKDNQLLIDVNMEGLHVPIFVTLDVSEGTFVITHFPSDLSTDCSYMNGTEAVTDYNIITSWLILDADDAYSFLSKANRTYKEVLYVASILFNAMPNRILSAIENNVDEDEFTFETLFKLDALLH